MRIRELFESDNPIRLKLGSGMMTIPMDDQTSEQEPMVIKLGGFGRKRGSAVSRFMGEWEAMTEEHPMNPQKRMSGGALVEVKPAFGENHVRLHDILSHEPGEGSRALKQLCWLADKHDIVLELTAMGYDKTPTERLVGWYERFGFKPLDPQWEARIHPKPADSQKPYFTPTVDMTREPQT